MRAMHRMRRTIALATSIALAGVITLDQHALAGPPASESGTLDEVRLNNGGFVRGEIVELMPGEYVIIRTSAGDTRRFEWSQVAEIMRGTTSMPGGTPEGVPGGTPGGIPGGTIEPTPIDPPPQPETPADEPDASLPTPEAPYLRLDAVKHPITLYRVTERAVASSGGYTATGVAYKRICDAPCSLQIDDPGVELFVGGEKYSGSKPFFLTPRASAYELRVKPRSKGMLIGGYVLMISGIMFGGFMAAGPFLVNMRRSQANAMFALAAVGGVGMIGGGITMMAFGRTKVEVLPRDANWASSP